MPSAGIAQSRPFTQGYSAVPRTTQQDLSNERDSDGYGRETQKSEINSPRTRESGSDSDSLSNTEGLSRLGMRLKKAGKGLRRMLNPPVNDQLTKSVVQGIHKGLLPAVDSERKEVMKLLDKYENHRSEIPHPELLNMIEDIIEDARHWSIGMREKHRELDCSKKSIDKKLYEGMKKFGADSDTNIFEFLKRLELYTEEQGTAKERAALLYEHYISKELQMEMIDRKNSYELMKVWLTKKFGEVKVITDNILKVVLKEAIPNDSTISTNLTNYYRKLNSVFKKIQELDRTVDVPKEDLAAHIYSNDFLSKLITLAPDKARFEFMDQWMSSGEDPERIKGSDAFALLA